MSQEVEATLRGHRTNTGSEMQPTSMWEQDARRIGVQSTEKWGLGKPQPLSDLEDNKNFRALTGLLL